MKRYLMCMGLAAMTVAGAGATELHADRIPSNAKWVLHIDLDQLRQGTVGRFLTGLAEQGLSNAELPFKADPKVLLSNIHSVTAFGDTYKLGEAGINAAAVLVIDTEKPVQEVVEGFLVQQSYAEGAKVSIEKSGPQGLYRVQMGDKGTLFVSVEPGGGIVVGRDPKELETGRFCLTGKGKSGGAPSAFQGLPSLPANFFFLALADGLNGAAKMPPQAKILQETDRVRIALGEASGDLRLQLLLEAKNNEVAKQIEQVLRGIAAFVSMAQPENQPLQQLAQGVKWNTESKLVKVDLSFPAEKAIQFIQEQHRHDVEKKKEADAGHQEAVEVEEPAKP